MQALYSFVNMSVTLDLAPAGAPAEANNSSSVSTVSTITGTLCVFPFEYQDESYTACISPNGAGSR